MATAAALSPSGSWPARSRAGTRAVRLWLYGLAALLVAMVAVGGATRLTGSGLSITEWRPVTGAVPPLTETGWAAEFERYRASSQYRNLNAGMSLADFRSIYWWEWGHRQLGRFIGAYAVLPLVWFWWVGAASGGLVLRIAGIAALGGLQAGIGWIMVASGLEPGMVAVAPVKLTLHLLVASLILALVVAVATGLAPVRRAAGGHPRIAALVLGLIAVQIGLGGLVAGLKAGLTYNTWPLMDGGLMPPGEALWSLSPAIENLVANPALVQLDHRIAAYLVVAAAVGQALLHLRRPGPAAAATRRAGIVAGLALAQAGLGVLTLLLVVPVWAGLAHQVLAMALLAAATHHLRATLAERGPADRPVQAASSGAA